MLGPLLIGALVGTFGWSAASALMLTAGVAGAALGLSLARDSSRRQGRLGSSGDNVSIRHEFARAIEP
ncbi:hypothetical protein [Cupriavidus basilensis]|uniref:hypothetical protein n=1 Tax=Cupriavidus basilensis TaxID=68895 RepID=UPI003D349A2A